MFLYVVAIGADAWAPRPPCPSSPPPPTAPGPSSAPPPRPRRRRQPPFSANKCRYFAEGSPWVRSLRRGITDFQAFPLCPNEENDLTDGEINHLRSRMQHATPGTVYSVQSIVYSVQWGGSHSEIRIVIGCCTEGLYCCVSSTRFWGGRC